MPADKVSFKNLQPHTHFGEIEDLNEEKKQIFIVVQNIPRLTTVKKAAFLLWVGVVSRRRRR